MAGLTKDKPTGIYAVQFHDPEHAPAPKRVSTRVRDGRATERLRRHWEAAYAVARTPWSAGRWAKVEQSEVGLRHWQHGSPEPENA